MKRKGGQNIIMDRDVTVTGNLNLGNSLDSVIEQHSEDILDLKSQLKWTHKYGAVGSGSGGSGPSKWAVVATLDGQTIDNGNTISLSNGASNYNLRIAVSGGSDTYNATYTYGNSSYSIDLNSANKWRADLTIPLNSNGVVSVEVTDNIQIKHVYATYIVTPFHFSDLQLCRNEEVHNLTNYDSPNLFVNQIATEGLYIKCNYDITVNAECSYTWKFLNDTKSGTIDDKNGYIVYNVEDQLEFINENANSYNVELIITISPENQSSMTISKSIVFNLIPDNLYLQLTPQSGLVYDAEVVELDGIYQYSINREIGFNVKTYNGINNNRDIDIFWWGDDDPMPERGYRGQEGKTYSLSISFSEDGWHAVHFFVQMGVDSYSVTKYLYCQQVASDFNWFRSTSPSASFAYKGYSSDRITGTILPNITSNYIQIYRANEDSSSYQLDYGSLNVDDPCNILVNVGVQYSDINNISEPICKIISTDNKDFITIYQNKVVFGGVTGSDEECNFFLHKEVDYNPGTVENYHLITISVAAVYFNSSNNNTYYEYNVYLDGVLEGSINTWPNAIKLAKTFEFCPGNYAINHFSVDYFSGVRGTSVIKDSDVNYYFYSYKVQSRNDLNAVSESERNILNFLYDPTTNKVNYSMVNNLVKLNSSTFYDDVAMNTTIPTLVFQVSEIQETLSGSPSIYDWMNTSYTQDSTDVLANAKITTKVKWGINSRTDFITIPVDNHEFFIKLQGSSTMNNKSKNFTLGLQKRTQDDGPTVLFSPNFKKDDTKTFLHETAFTLKADVVDSSHTNNVAMGKFINDWNDFSYDINQSGVDPDILSHVRKCLDGFPVLVYLEVVGADGQTINGDYYLGVYSFNLGRDSYFNLGYSDLSQLNPNYITDATATTFSFTTVGSGNDRGLDPLEGFVSAEVQDNSIYWDFSQYDPTILFKQGSEQANYMFGDIATYASNTGANNSIQEFVKRVSKAGGYLFKEIGKTFVNVKNEFDPESNEYAYHTPNVVPDYRTQYVRDNKTYTIKETTSDASYGDLLSCVGGEQDGEEIEGYVNYNSISNYYTTCMTFGLVDSVQKNLTIKTWDGKQFGAFFYDMDTCLGRDNNGNPTSYFCFSDYWRSDIKEYDENGNLIDRALSPNAIAELTVNNGVTVDRDYFPITNNITGYDIPSSYLFAIAKYTKILDDYKNDDTYKSPQTIYAEWRKVGGPLETAKTFIDRYYASNLAEVPDCLLNLNYRNKYLYYSNESGDKTAFDSISKFLFGKGIETTTNWLNGRLHILDAYFNLEGADIVINNNYKELIPITQNLNNNKDIIILKDMFAPGNQPWSRKSSNLEFKVTAPDYTPLIIRGANNVREFLLEHADVEYTIRTSFNGVQTSVFGGSQLWNTLDTINSFVESSAADTTSLYVNNPYLETIVGTSGSYTGGFNLILPAVKQITLTSSGYAGILTVDSSFGNLSSIDISGSSISLNANEALVRTINAQGINSDSLTITNCPNVTDVNLINANIQSCSIAPAWTKDINLSNNKIKSLSISGKPVNSQYGTLTINNNATMTDVVFDNFENISIDNCAKLSRVISNDAIHSRIKTLSITNCPTLRSIAIYADGLTSLNLSGCVSLTDLTLLGDSSTFPNLTSLNLNNTKVTSIKFSNNDIVTDVLDLTKFTNLGKTNNSSITIQKISGLRAIRFTNTKNDPVKLNKSFSGCVDLERIYGNVSVCVSSCFYQLYKFSIHGSNLENLTWKGSYVLDDNRVKHPYDISNDLFADGTDVTNLTFGVNTVDSCFRETNCTVFDYYYAFANIGSAKSVSHLFSYPRNSTWGKFDVTNGNNIDKRIFVNCEALTQTNMLFYGGSHKMYLQSPTISGDTVVSDDGLLSPLVNVTNASYMFAGTYYIDRFLFRRTSGNYKFTNLSYFRPTCCFNKPSGDSWSTINNTYSNLDYVGNLGGFFNNLPALVTCYGIFGGVNYINYNNLFKLPTGVKIVLSSFNSAKADCEDFVISRYFDTPSLVTHIAQSFRKTGDGTDTKVTMYLDNDTFSSFTNLKVLGHDSSISGDFTGTYSVSSFGGFNKFVDASGFPFDIFKNCTKLESVTGVFEGVECMNGSIADLRLPGTLFKYNTKLKETARLFYNIKIPYQLSDDINFKNCPNIEIVDYMFGQPASNANYPVLSGSIPYGFFQHGSSTIQITPASGTNERTETEVDGEVVYEYGELETPETFTVNSYNRSIKSMKYCFYHSNLNPYINTTPAIELNPNYNPYHYISVDGEMIETSTSPQYTLIWSYDGQNLPLDYDESIYEMLDLPDEDRFFKCVPMPLSNQAGSGQESPSANYIAPPDLLRYCKTDCDIEGLFACSGLSGWSTTYNNTDLQYNMLGFGLTGRICPYMLKPVSGTTSVKNMFKWCKKLSYYYYDDLSAEQAYMIPEDFFTYAKNVNDLTSMFEDTLQPNGSDLSNVFKPLKGTLDLTNLFYRCYWSGTNYISGVFSTNEIKATDSAFALALHGETSTDRTRTQHITFSNIFNPKYSKANYITNTAFHNTFSGYNSSVTFGTKTLNDDPSTYNYFVYGQ